MNRITHLKAYVLVLALAACATATRDVTDRQIADENRTADWLAYGRTHSETRFSPLQDINVDTVKQLGVDWYLDLPNDRGLVSTPLIVDGVMYFIGSMNRVRALDAMTGELFWEFDPGVAENTGNDLRTSEQAMSLRNSERA